MLNNPQRNSLSTCVHARMHARVIVRAQGDGMGGVHDHLICKHVAYYYSFFFIFLHLFVKENINSFMFKWTKSVLFLDFSVTSIDDMITTFKCCRAL